MAPTSPCPRCGSPSQPGFQFCSNCGAALPGAAQAAGTPPGPAPYSPPYPAPYPSPQAYQAMVAAQETRKRVDWTRTGLLLMIIGILIGWVPYVNFFGIILIVVGGFLVIFGRRSFGPLHSRNVMISLSLVIGAIIAEIALFIILFAMILGQFATPGGPPDPTAILEALAGVIDAYLIGAAMANGVIALAAFLFTYKLQQRLGQYLLGAGLAANVAVQVLRYLVLRTLFATLFSGGLPTTPPNPFTLTLLGTQAIALSLLAGIPAALNGGGYYLAWARINRGEIPAPPAGHPPPTYPTHPVPPPAGPG